MLEKGVELQNRNINDNKTYTSLLQLFQEMISSPLLHEKIDKLISKNVGAVYISFFHIRKIKMLK